MPEDLELRLRAKLAADLEDDLCGAEQPDIDGWRWHVDELLKWLDDGAPYPEE